MQIPTNIFYYIHWLWILTLWMYGYSYAITMVFQQCGFFIIACHIYCDTGHPFIKVICRKLGRNFVRSGIILIFSYYFLVWLKYCRYVVKHYPINQSLAFYHFCPHIMCMYKYSLDIFVRELLIIILWNHHCSWISWVTLALEWTSLRMIQRYNIMSGPCQKPRNWKKKYYVSYFCKEIFYFLKSKCQ